MTETLSGASMLNRQVHSPIRSISLRCLRATAGSEILECTTEEEIPVKVSRGEYTDDFLR